MLFLHPLVAGNNSYEKLLETSQDMELERLDVLRALEKGDSVPATGT